MKGRQSAEIEKLESESFLLTEPATEVLPWLELRDLGRLGLTCTFFQKPLLMARAAHFVIVEPSESEVAKTLEVNPELVLTKIKRVTDKSKRTMINSTLLQMAYGARDYAMCDVLKPYFVRACGSEEAAKQEIRRQIKEKFDEENKEKNAENEIRIKNHIAALLATVIQAITNEQFNHGQDTNGKWILDESTKLAIEKFRNEFAASQPKIIKKGMHFRLETLKEVCEAHTQATHQWSYHYLKSALLEDAVLSFVLRYVPTNDAQRFNQGLGYFQDEGGAEEKRYFSREEFMRANTTRDGHDFYLALCKSSIDFPLEGSCVAIKLGRVTQQHDVSHCAGGCRTVGAESCQTYVDEKIQTSRTYDISLLNESASTHRL